MEHLSKKYSDSNPAGSDSLTMSDYSDDYLLSYQNFSLDLFKRLVNGETNTIISPTSVYLALSMVSAGADSQTKKEFEELLGSGKIGLDEVNENNLLLHNSLKNNSGDTKLNIANSIWFDESSNVNDKFLQSNSKYYESDIYATDLRAPGAVDLINSWADEKTEHLIPEIVSEISGETYMLLINTIYFNAKWSSPFNKENTQKANFTAGNSANVKTDFMNASKVYRYKKYDNYEAILLPYNDNRYQLVAALPNEGLSIEKFIDSLDPSFFEEVRYKKMDEVNVNLSIPKFESVFDVKLKESIMDMGLLDAFSESADFSGIANNEPPLLINDVIHKSYIRVDEDGTEAAAATSVEAYATSLPLNPVNLTFDRPFFYAVIDTETKLPLFMGVLNNPTE